MTRQIASCIYRNIEAGLEIASAARSKEGKSPVT